LLTPLPDTSKQGKSIEQGNSYTPTWLVQTPRRTPSDGYWARPIRLFSCVLFFCGTFTPWLIVGLAHFAGVRFFAFSSLLFVFSHFPFLLFKKIKSEQN
jgi:hypothetical protein